MKPKFLLPVCAIALLSMAAIKVSDDIIGKLGTDHATAQNYIMANFTGGFGTSSTDHEHFFSLPRLNALASIVNGDKVGAAQELCAYVKTYCNSEEFMNGYQKKRADSKPVSEPPRTDEAVLQSMRDGIRDLEKSVADLKKSPKENAQAIALYEPMIAEQKASLAQYEDPTPNKTKWEKDYPSDPALLVKGKLENYLALVSTVDFDATLTAPDAYQITKFVNPEYERMPPEWKACFRAGKEVNDAVSSFAREWLKGEIISANKTKMNTNADLQTNAGDNLPANGMENADKAVVQNQTDQGAEPVDSLGQSQQPKKSLLGKLKAKAKNLIKE